MTEFTPVTAIIGGSLIGVAAVILLLGNGRIMGVSGILGGAISRARSQWQLWFIAGVIAGPALIHWVATSHQVVAGWQINLPSGITLSWWQIVTGGVLVGVGTRMGSGCTSGHGVCGIGRFSKRSFVATCVFMCVAILTVWVLRHFLLV